MPSLSNATTMSEGLAISSLLSLCALGLFFFPFFAEGDILGSGLLASNVIPRLALNKSNIGIIRCIGRRHNKAGDLKLLMGCSCVSPFIEPLPSNDLNLISELEVAANI